MNLMEDNFNMERMIMEKSKIEGVPVYGCIELTPLCNMKCEMCYVRMSQEEMEQQGRLRTAEEWLAAARQMQQAGMLFLLLTGGEPLIYPDFKKVYLGFRDLGMILTINTNGTMIDKEWAEFFVRNRPRRINITLYGKDEDTYHSLCHYKQGYKQTLQAVRLLTERGIDVKLNVSAASTNMDDIEEILDIGKKLGVPVRVDAYMMPAVRERKKPYAMQARLTPEKAARIQVFSLKREMGSALFSKYVMQALERVEHFMPSDQPGGMTCYAGNCSFTINWQGNLRPCVVMSTPSVNVFEKGFLPAWKEVQKECQTIKLNMKCSQCRLRPICRTCAACARLETGDYRGVPEYMCRYTEERYRLLKLEAERICHE